MSQDSRREFIKQSALAAAFGATLTGNAKPQAAAKTDLAPELAIVNAVVYTVDDKQPKAEAFAVRDGKFVAVGSTAEIRALTSAKTRIIDAQGMIAVPGFIDAHTHPAYGGNRELLQVNCDKRTIAEIQAVIKERVARAKPDEWIFGFKYDDTKLQDGRPLLRKDLDEVAPKHPVRVEHRGGHTCVCNSAAFQAAGVTKQTPDPKGGKFGRDDQGELTGYAAELALDVIAKAGKPPQSTPKQRQAAVKLMAELMTAAGLTSVHDVDATKEDFIAYQDALAAGELPFRVYALLHTPYFEVLRAAGIRHGYGNDWLRVGGVKMYVDGSASERTMRMSKPYVGRPNDYGILVTTQDKLNDQVLEAHKDGYQIGIHANGDVAIDMVLNAYELAQRAHPRQDFRHKIEHCTLINEMLLKRIAAIGAIPTPFYTYVYYHGDKWNQYGEERTQSMFAHRSFLDHKIKVAGASDYVPGPFEPLMAIQSMVTRKDYRGRVWGANQKITVPEALQVCTINGAYASYEEKTKGSITAGKLADFVLLAEDPHKVDPDKIKDIKVARTVVGGRTVHPKES